MKFLIILKTKKIDCDICNENKFKAIYKCKCAKNKQSYLCNDCYLKLDKCPFCIEDISKGYGKDPNYD